MIIGSQQTIRTRDPAKGILLSHHLNLQIMDIKKIRCGRISPQFHFLFVRVNIELQFLSLQQKVSDSRFFSQENISTLLLFYSTSFTLSCILRLLIQQKYQDKFLIELQKLFLRDMLLGFEGKQVEMLSIFFFLQCLHRARVSCPQSYIVQVNQVKYMLSIVCFPSLNKQILGQHPCFRS